MKIYFKLLEKMRMFRRALMAPVSGVYSPSPSATVAARTIVPPPGSLLAVKYSIFERRVIVYDGVCYLCHKGVRWVIKLDKDEKIKFCCLQSKAAVPYLRMSGLEREDVLKRFLFFEGPDEYHQGSTAALRVLSHLPFPYSALSVLLMLIPPSFRDAVYDYIAERRYHWFGKGNDCLVLQDKKLLERFIAREELLDHEKSNEDSEKSNKE